MTPLEKLRGIKPKTNNLVKIENNFIEGFLINNDTLVIKILFYLSKTNNLVDRGLEFSKFSLNIKEMIEFCNIDRKTLIRKLNRLQETSIKIVDSEDKLISVSLLPKYEIDYSTNNLIFSIENNIRDMVIQVERSYTIIDTQNLMKLHYKHSLKMIQLLEKFEGYSENIGKRGHFTLEELNLLFGVNYKNCYSFERKILIPCKEELDNESKLSFVYHTKKDLMGKGRPKSVGFTIDLVDNKVRQTTMSF